MTTFPPTPAPSTDILGKKVGLLQADALTLVLPPSAIKCRNGGSPPDVSYQESEARPPIAPPATLSKRPSNSLVSPHYAELPPAPTRSRKIIQMKPKPLSLKLMDEGEPPKSTPGTPTSARKKSGNTSAGRKIARKTAHSLIERRRRSKMNEEFGVLKNMIPACAGHEMHKLSILQASIDYLRYLEKCIAELKSNGTHQTMSASCQPLQAPSKIQHNSLDTLDSEDDLDEEMEDDAQHTPPTTDNDTTDKYRNSLSCQSTSTAATSPAFSAHSPSHRNYRYATNAELPSPLFGPSQWQRPYSNYYLQSSRLPSPSIRSLQSNPTSPALLPQLQGRDYLSDIDHEASTALLMLNATDRRDTVPIAAQARVRARTGPGDGIRGLSVKDLLSN